MPFHRPSQPNGEISGLREEVAALRREQAETAGQVAAIDASVTRLRDDLQDGQDRLERKLDELLGLRSRVEDHTERVKLLEDDRGKSRGWADRMAWIWLGVTGLAAAVIAGWQLYQR